MDAIRLAIDCVVFDGSGRLLLIRRNNPPFEGQWALPGGFVEYGETTEEAAMRELKEETGLSATSLRLVGVYSRPDRDPRGHIISIAYRTDVNSENVRAGDDAVRAEFVTDWKDISLAFDHNKIVADALAIG